MECIKEKKTEYFVGFEVMKAVIMKRSRLAFQTRHYIREEKIFKQNISS
jgi:hypothetical protein